MERAAAAAGMQPYPICHPSLGPALPNNVERFKRLFLHDSVKDNFKSKCDDLTQQRSEHFFFFSHFQMKATKWRFQGRLSQMEATRRFCTLPRRGTPAKTHWSGKSSILDTISGAWSCIASASRKIRHRLLFAINCSRKKKKELKWETC